MKWPKVATYLQYMSPAVHEKLLTKVPMGAAAYGRYKSKSDGGGMD